MAEGLPGVSRWSISPTSGENSIQTKSAVAIQMASRTSLTVSPER